MIDIFKDARLVLTLDAGGTNFVFNAIQRGVLLLEPLRMPSNGDNLVRCLQVIVAGFQKVLQQVDVEPDAISFAFPGPADYPNGIIGDLTNLPGFRNGVALKAMLEDVFNIPVYIQNDGNLFAYGHALGGSLPLINKQLKESGSNKVYRNLIGLTLGTGFGAGLVSNNQLIIGDNSIAGEVWNMSNSISPHRNAEAGVSARAIVNSYNRCVEHADRGLTPKDIYAIALQQQVGNQQAALEAFRVFGIHLGDAISNLINLFDGVVVIGGGLAEARQLYMPAVKEVVRGGFLNNQARMVQQPYFIDDKKEADAFYSSSSKLIKVPFSKKMVAYDLTRKIAITTSHIDASKAISLGAYAYALSLLNKKEHVISI